MNIAIKNLKLNGKIFVPQTTAEAVLVKKTTDSETSILTLDSVLDEKVDAVYTPAKSGLLVFKLGTTIYIAHSNEIDNLYDNPTALKIKYDNRGHIIETSPTESLVLTVNNEKYATYSGLEETNIKLGDDFNIDEKKDIKLNWINT